MIVSLRAFASAALLLIACGPQAQPPAPPANPAVDPGPAPEAAEPALAEQPKPGERVRQASLDANCEEPAKALAFYYHGGRPFMQRAIGDGCSPLYLAECSADGTCATAKEPEQGMWCCAGSTPQTARADKR